MSLEEIVKDGNYKGLRVGLNAHLDRTRQRLQIDIGFGDAVLPHPMQITYPIILEMDAPQLLAYSVESTIAEKFEAMIDLAEVNTRMKDFYDVYNLLSHHTIQEPILKQAIQETFNRRQTPTPPTHSLFSESFNQNVNRQKMWQAWKNKVRLGGDLTFPEAMATIEKRLKPIYQELSSKG